MIFNPFRYRYTAVIIGQESGNVTPLTFIKFRKLHKARVFVDQLNKINNETSESLVRVELREL